MYNDLRTEVDLAIIIRPRHPWSWYKLAGSLFVVVIRCYPGGLVIRVRMNPEEMGQVRARGFDFYFKT
jgi:hypothetical protein